MTAIEIVDELLNIKKFNYTLASDEVFDTAIKAVLAYGVEKGTGIRKGKWIKGSNGFVCSECGYRSILKPFALVEQDGEMVQVTEMNFCYKCGADMRGEQE